MSSQQALKLAEDAELDLVCVAPAAKPPVCKIIDYGKYRYELARKEKEAKKQAALELAAKRKAERAAKEASAEGKEVKA